MNGNHGHMPPQNRSGGGEQTPTPSRPDRSAISHLSSFLSRHGAKILTLAPLVFVIWIVVRYAVDVPFWDQWELVPLLEKSYHSEVTLHDLWAQHNEHRQLFPWMIMLLLARLTHWNIRYELATNIILALGFFAVLARQVKITGRKPGWNGLLWAIPAISLIVFSIAQYENWLWGWQLQIFLNLLAAVSGIVLLADETFNWPRFTAAAFLGVVATYSFANGILFWPIGLAILLIITAGARERWPALIGWISIGTLTLGTYFHHYQKPQEHPPLGLIFEMPLEYVTYVFKYIGGICAQGLSGDRSLDGAFAFVFGLAATATFGWAGATLVRRKITNVRTLLPYFAMSLYSIGSALITGIGRLGHGSNQAMAPRYCTMVIPLWVSLIVFLILLTKGDGNAAGTDSHEARPGQKAFPRSCQTVARWLLMGSIILLILGSVFATSGARNLSRRQAYGRARLLGLAANPQADIDYNGLSAIYPRPETIVQRYPVLVKHQLSLFRDRKTSLNSQ